MLSVVVLIPISTILDIGQLPLCMVSIVPWCAPSQSNVAPYTLAEAWSLRQAAASSPIALWRGCHLGPELESLFRAAM